ncbi:MAG: WecB/TagA/CpsF family glycosyltransferase [Patescibacteria group bacterium]
MKILDIKIDSIKKTDALAKIEQFLDSDSPHQIATVNAEFILESQKNNEFKEILNNSDLNLADSVSMQWAATLNNAKLTQIPIFRSIQAILIYKIAGAAIIFNKNYISKIIPERISGADLIWDIAKLAEEKKTKIFLLGGRDSVAEFTASKLVEKYPKLIIAGTSEANPEQDITDEIKKTGAKIIFVAYGAPKQEIWISNNLAKTGAKVGIGVGGTFDFIAGKAKRAPKFIRSIGLEWLWRLILQPSRIKRIYNAFIKFSFIVLITKIKEK